MTWDKLKHLLKKRLKNRGHQQIIGETVPKARLLSNNDLENRGGCRLFVDDINNDDDKEFLWLQSAGMFKSHVFDEVPLYKNYLDTVGRNVFCLTATNMKGEILWQVGQPYQGEYAYLSHAAEHMLAFADVNNDGYNEILVLDGANHLLILNPGDGSLYKKIKLPADNFSIVYYLKTGAVPHDFVVLLGVTDRGYEPHPYANPWIILDDQFEVISSRDYLGAGHNVVVDDINKDGLPEILIGYQLVNLRGEVLWTLDDWDGKEINYLEQHVDDVTAQWIDGEWFATISGSDKQYFINAKGETLWVKTLPHPQCSVMGRCNGERRIFVVNQRELMNSYRLDGTEVWRGLLPECWPMGKPASSRPERPIHMNDPVNLISMGLAEENDYILYKEGGWPYVIDFNGNIIQQFPHTPRVRANKPVVPFNRLNDIGLAYEAEAVDINNDGMPEILIYNRENLWVYTLQLTNSPLKH